ncbi:Os11g0637050 [Oryza sativa Japonica Group]|uniref:Os11g0637050 protein n=1 Tax=Oryza sativa subsp. japonica TaxID=39947 RepID=A0A0P0Y4S8_ORYSJ|nr:Os11g0637050 [Oryza sativa Japonica Group]
MVIPPATEMNVMLITPHVSRFTTMPRLAPCARSRSGNTSAVYAAVIGPSPAENAATNATTDATHAAALAADGGATRSVRASEVRVTAMPPVLASRSGRQPRRSEKSVATRMEHVLATPTATVAPRTEVFDAMPAFLNTTGL